MFVKEWHILFDLNRPQCGTRFEKTAAGVFVSFKNPNPDAGRQPPSASLTVLVSSLDLNGRMQDGDDRSNWPDWERLEVEISASGDWCYLNDM